MSKTADRVGVRREEGFTILEALVVVFIVGILVLMVAPAFLNMFNRIKLTGTAREIASLMQAARMESIKMGAPAFVVYDTAENRFYAFVDLDRDGTESDADRVLAATVPVPTKVEFRGPGDGAIAGTNAIDGWDDAPAQEGPIFRSDGSVDRVGAYRLRDSNGNYLEVRVETPATGRIVLRKRDEDGVFYLNGESGHNWTWK